MYMSCASIPGNILRSANGSNSGNGCLSHGCLADSITWSFVSHSASPYVQSSAITRVERRILITLYSHTQPHRVDCATANCFLLQLLCDFMQNLYVVYQHRCQHKTCPTAPDILLIYCFIGDANAPQNTDLHCSSSVLSEEHAHSIFELRIQSYYVPMHMYLRYIVNVVCMQ